MNPISKITDAVSKISGDAEDMHTSIEEERTLLNDFHQADMMSDSWLSKNIRPIMWIASYMSLILAMFLSLKYDIPEVIIFQLGAAFGGISALYIPLRSYEKRQRMRLNEAKSKMYIEKVQARIDRKSVRTERRASK